MSAQPKPTTAFEDTQAGMGHLRDRSIGSLIAEARQLDADQVETILAHQRKHGLRFGEAAIALGFASPEQVLQALAQQFHYPLAAPAQRERSPHLVALNQPFSARSEMFRAIRSQVLMRLNRDGMPRSALAVVSTDRGDGKSYFAANLAVSLAQLGGRTLLVDADLRNPSQHALFDAPNQHGLSYVLMGRAQSQLIQLVAGVPSLHLLTVGAVPPNPSELLERPAFKLLMRELIERFDHVIVDTTAATCGADASIVASRCGAALLLARENHTRQAALRAVVDSLDGSTTQLIGTVLNAH